MLNNSSKGKNLIRSSLSHHFHEQRDTAMADDPVRFGIIGCAGVARKLCRAIALAPNATLHALGSRSVAEAQSFAAANGLPGSVRLYGSYGAVLDDPLVDAVYLPLPTSLRAAWAVAAARKGKHVLLEKPAAADAAELDRILEACGASGVQFMDGTMWLHHPRTAKMMEIVSDRGRFGELKWVSIECFGELRFMCISQEIIEHGFVHECNFA